MEREKRTYSDPYNARRRKSNMNLVMFDIDGTLTQTNKVDTDCFVQALDDVLGIKNVDTNWARYRNVTDQGCAEEIIEIHKGRSASKDELAGVKERHVELLRERADAEPGLFLSIPGAQDILNSLRRQSHVVAALATGGWLESAHIKLHGAGILTDGLPMATCNDAISRYEIMAIAEARAKDQSGVTFTTKTYIGDAVWDVEASRELGYFFIGIGSGNSERALRAEGAKWTVPDFLERNGFEEILQAIWDSAFIK